MHQPTSTAPHITATVSIEHSASVAAVAASLQSSAPQPSDPLAQTASLPISDRRPTTVAPYPATSNISILENLISELSSGLQGLASIVGSVTPSSTSTQDYTTTQQQIAALQNEIAQTNRVSNLSNVTISAPSISGGSITASSISGTISNAVNAALGTIASLGGTELTYTRATFESATTTNLYAGNASIGTASTTNLTVNGTATSTFAGGIAVFGGCVSVNGICLGAGGGGSSTWGAIAGTLSNQTDLQSALDAKLSLSSWYATTTNGLAEGSTNLYFTNARVASVIAGTTTNALAEGTTNKYFTNARAQSAISVLGAPLSYSSGIVGINLASGSQPGYLSSADWTAFNNKIASTSLSGGTGISYNPATGVIANTGITSNAGDWSGTLGGFTPAQLAAAGFSTTSAAYWKTQNNFFATSSSDYWLTQKTTDNLAQGSTNKYYSTLLFAADLAGTTTNALKEGGSNLYFTNGRVDTEIGNFLQAGSGISFTNNGSSLTISSTGGGGGGTDVNWAFVNNSGLRPATSTNQVLIGGSSTSSLDKLQVIGGATIDHASTTRLSAYGPAYFGASATSTFDSTGALTLATSLVAGSGGTGISSVAAAGVLVGNYAGTGWQQIATSSLGLLSTNVAEGSNLYFTNNRVASVIAGTTTDALAQGSTNKYWSNTLFDNALSGTTSVRSITTLPSLSLPYVQLSGTPDLSVYLPLATWFATTSAPQLTALENLATVGTITSGTWSGLFGAVSGANLTNLTAANISAGTAGVNVTGNAGTATKLAATKNINSVAFDGSADITITAASSTLLSNNNTFTDLDTFANATSTLFTFTTGWGSTLNLSTALGISSGGTGLATTGASSTVLTTNGTTNAWQKLDLGSAVYGTLAAAQFPALTGDITTAAGSLATALKSTGTAGTYRSATFDAQGRETSGTNPTTFSGYAISDSAANLRAALTDSTGTGSAVFSASPTFTGKITAAAATSTDLTASNSLYTPVTSALLLADGNKLTTAYGGSTCTNQFTRSLNGAGVATCSSVSLTADVTGTLGVGNGGTGWGNIVSNTVLLGNGAGAISTTTRNNLLVGSNLSISGGSSALLGGDATISLGSNVVTSVSNDTNVTGSIASNALTLGWTGTLGVARGGTASSTLTGILKGNGTSAVQTAIGGTDYEFPLTFSTGLTRSTNTITLNTGNASTWTALQQFSNASTSLFSASGPAYFGRTATTTIDGAGNIAGAGTLALNGTTGTTTIATGQGFTVGGSQFVLQQGSGNVGIGTTTPGANITIIPNATPNTFSIGSSTPLMLVSNVGSTTLRSLLTNLTYASGGEEYTLTARNDTSTAFSIYESINTDPTSFYDSVQGVTHIPASATIGQATGIAGYVKNDSATTNGVGVFSAATADVNNSKVWGLNTLLQDSASRAIDTTSTGKITIGAELDFNIMSTSTQLIGVSIGGNSLAQSNNANGFLVNSLGVGKWGTAFWSLAGAATNGLVLGASATGGTNTASQNMLLQYYDNAAAQQTFTLQGASDPSGDYLSLTNTGATTTSVKVSSSVPGKVGAAFDLVNTGGALNDAGSIRFFDSEQRGELKFSVDRSPYGADLVYLSGDGAQSEKFRITTAGNVGIGTTTPGSALDVNGADGAIHIRDTADPAGRFFSVGPDFNSNFTIYNNGGVGLYLGYGATSWTANSDERLKTNITALATSSLDQILALNPVTFNWKDTNQNAEVGTQLGFIAQQVQQVYPQLVSTGGTTTVTNADGSTTTVTNTLGLNYTGLIPPIVKAIQEIASITATFKSNLIAWLGNASNDIGDLFADNIHAHNELCVGSTCVTEAQFKAMVAAANASPSSGERSTSSPSGASSSDSSATTTPATPPIIQINGTNPAIIQIGASYADLGATITGPQADLNLGIKRFLNGSLTSDIVIDTSAVATDTIDYVVTDQSGLTSTSTRTVIIASQASPPPSSDATTTGATSTSQ